MPELKKTYPTHKIYFCTLPQFQELLDDNEFIDKFIPYHDSLNNALYLEGLGNHEGFFDLAFIPENCVDLKAIGHHNGNFQLTH